MYLFRVGGNTYRVKFGYGALCRTDIIDKLLRSSQFNNDDPGKSIKNIISLLPEMLLEGLQSKHKDQFGYDTQEEREEKLELVCEMLDDYEEEHEDDETPLNGYTLFADLQKELERNGFLSQISRDTQSTAENQNATVIPKDHQKKVGAKK